MPDDLFPVEKRIYEVLAAECMTLYPQTTSLEEWTRGIKTCLCGLAKSDFGLHPWAGKCTEAEYPEWLWDVAWLRYGPARAGREDWMGLEGVFLACEIEWQESTYNRLEDFLKLTVAVADYRLFIFTIPNTHVAQDARAKIFDELKEVCPGSRGFRYLAIGVPNHPHKPEDGKLPYAAWSL